MTVEITEVEEVNTTIVSLYIEYYIYIFGCNPISAVDEYIDSLINSPYSSVLLIHNGEKCIGFCTIQEVSSTALMSRIVEVLDFWVSKRYRRSGLGRDAVEQLQKLLINKGYKAVELFTTKDNIAANKFWDSLGFTRGNLEHYRKSMLTKPLSGRAKETRR